MNNIILKGSNVIYNTCPILSLTQIKSSGYDLNAINTPLHTLGIQALTAYNKNVAYYKDSFTKSGAGVIDCRVDESYVKKLLGYFKRRG